MRTITIFNCLFHPAYLRNSWIDGWILTQHSLADISLIKFNFHCFFVGKRINFFVTYYVGEAAANSHKDNLAPYIIPTIDKYK